MNKEYKEVKEFHKAFNHPYSETPKVMELNRAKKRYTWILEEINEFLVASEKGDIAVKQTL